MKTYSAIILDDEYLVRIGMKIKIETFCPELKILALCGNVDDAIEKIYSFKPDIIFLDVDLKDGKDGFVFIEELKKTGIPSQVIIVSQFDKKEYFLKAIKFSVVWFLEKPFLKEELQAAVSEAIKKVIENELKSFKDKFLDSLLEKTICFKEAKGKVWILPTDIVYIQGKGNGCLVCLMGGKAIEIFESLKSISEKFLGTSIIKVDKSHYINIVHIAKIDKENRLCYFKEIANQLPILLNSTGIKILLGLDKK